jgi:hypothetical protein
MSAFGGIADIGHVCFTPKSGHHRSANICPLCAKSGHMQCSNSRSIGASTDEFLPAGSAGCKAPEVDMKLNVRGLPRRDLLTKQPFLSSVVTALGDRKRRAAYARLLPRPSELKPVTLRRSCATLPIFELCGFDFLS